MAPRSTPSAELAEADGDAGFVRPTGLWNRLLWIMEHLPNVAKTGEMKSSAGSYSFVEETEVMRLARPLFIQAGVYMAVNEISFEQLERETKYGKSRDMTVKVVEYTFINADDGTERHTMRVHAMAQDSLDKGPGKALTAAGKMAVLKALMMPTGDDLEVDNGAADTAPANRSGNGGGQQRNGGQQRGNARPGGNGGGQGKPQQAAEPPASLQTLAAAVTLANDAMLPPSERKKALEYLERPGLSEAKVKKMITRLNEMLEEGGDDDD